MHFCGESLKTSHIELRMTGQQEIQFECRPSQISQVLMNLIKNSQDALENLPEKWIEVHAKQNAEQIRISVTDSGSGIKGEIADKIMQPFFTTKEIGKGTGLGLSIAQGIVASHGGTLELDSKSPHTKFVIQLPLHQHTQTSQPIAV